MENLIIRQSREVENAAIEALYPQAFPDEDLLPLVRSLLCGAPDSVSLVAVRGGECVGHIVFTTCRLSHEDAKPALLGPLAVAPHAQQQGIGSRLVEDGLARLKSAGFTHVLVLGDPRYYGRFGFAAEHAIMPPYPLPEQWQGAWQSKGLQGAATPSSGLLQTPPPWNARALWAP